MRLAPSSLRGRLAALFAAGSSVLLLLASGLLYLDLHHELDAAVNAGLRARARDLAAAAHESGDRRELPAADPFAQLLTANGRVLASAGAAVAAGAVLSPGEAALAAQREIRRDRDVAGIGEDSRLLARPVLLEGDRDVVVVGTSRRPLVRGQRRLALELIVAAPALIAVLAAGGWLMASAALRPVQRLTAEAERISLTEPDRRLPDLPGDDEIARLGHTLNAMLDRIQASFEHEQAFVDDASHELRTPVSILRGELELALTDAGDRRQVEAALRSALEEAERLGRLADDLLVLARDSAGRLPLRLEPVDVDTLARRVASAHTDGPDVVIVGAPLSMLADPVRLEQLLVNLVANARRHAVSAVDIVLADSPPSITVADDGAGFPPTLLPRAFDRFTRGDADRGRSHGGAGLGLAIVAAIARAHGWSVDAGNGGPRGGAWVRVAMPTSPVG